MDETVQTIVGIFCGVLFAMFIASFIAVWLIKRRQNKKKLSSIPASTDGSEYGEYLAEKYRNERIEKGR